MMNILALRRGLAYEGDLHMLRAIHPTPVFARARCDKLQDMEHGQCSHNLFREDSFDPVTRIRRGRLYRLDGGLKQGSGYCVENIHNYPFGPHSGVASGSWDPECLYRPINIGDFNSGIQIRGLVIHLGPKDFETIWRLVDVERILTGDLLFTLRAISSWGTVPVLNDEIKDKAGDAVDPAPISTVLDRVVTALNLQQPVLTVDACREAARVVLAAWLGPKSVTKDLNDVIKSLPNEREMIRNAAFIIKQFHPRGKSSEQEKQGAKHNPIRQLADEDAETGVKLIGLMLREIGWAAP